MKFLGGKGRLASLSHDKRCECDVELFKITTKGHCNVSPPQDHEAGKMGGGRKGAAFFIGQRTGWTEQRNLIQGRTRAIKGGPT